MHLLTHLEHDRGNEMHSIPNLSTILVQPLQATTSLSMKDSVPQVQNLVDQIVRE
jgi:hypothetical protein